MSPPRPRPLHLQANDHSSAHSWTTFSLLLSPSPPSLFLFSLPHSSCFPSLPPTTTSPTDCVRSVDNNLKLIVMKWSTTSHGTVYLAVLSLFKEEAPAHKRRAPHKTERQPSVISIVCFSMKQPQHHIKTRGHN